MINTLLHLITDERTHELQATHIKKAEAQKEGFLKEVVQFKDVN